MIVLTLGLVVVGVAQEKLHRTAHNDMALLSWLAGCWEGPFENGRWEVCYTTPDWGQMLGANKEIVGGKVNMIEFEHFTIVDDRLVITVTGIERGQDKTLTLDLTRRS